MKKLSVNELIDLVALNRVLDNTESVVWGYDDGYHYISDAHMAVKVRMTPKTSTALRSLFGRFHGEIPKAGTALRSIQNGKRYNVDTVTIDAIKRCLEDEAYIPLNDTKIMYETGYGSIVRAFHAIDYSKNAYIFLNMAFLQCVNQNSTVRAVHAEPRSMVKFTREDEVAVILPVAMATPEYMADLN